MSAAQPPVGGATQQGQERQGEEPAAGRPAGGGLGGPEQARARLRGFVLALHQAYLASARLLAPGEQGALPLLAAPRITVVVAAARHLHLLATAAPLPPPRGQEVEEPDEADGLRWSVRFYDPVVLPALGLIPEAQAPDPGGVRQVLGISDVIYHLSVAPGGGLSPHHAQHAGTGLANQHAALARDEQALRALLPGREDLAGEFAAAERLGLRRSMRLLAAELSGGDHGVAQAAASDDDAALRRAVLAAVRSARAAEAVSG